MDRRDFLQMGATAIAGVAAARVPLRGIGQRGVPRDDDDDGRPGSRIEEATMAELQAAMEAGRLTARSLSRIYLGRIEALDRRGPRLNSIIEVNPDVGAIARELD